MSAILKKVIFVLTILLMIAAAVFYIRGNYAEGGLALTLGWLTLAIAMMLVKSLARFAYTVVIFAAVTVSMSFPQYFLSVGSWQTKSLIVPLLQLITFGVGCTMSWHDLSGVLKMPKAVFIGTACHFMIMPLVGFTIAKSFGFPPEIAAGIVLVGCSPSGLASNVVAFIAKANLGLSVTITAVSTLLSPIMTPLLMKLLGGQFVPVSFSSMFWDIIRMVILPIFLGVLVNHLFKKKALWIDAVMPRVSMLGVTLVIAVITAAGRDNLLHVGVALVFAVFLHMTVGLFLGYWGARLFRLPERDCRTVGIEVGMQNSGLASGIAAQMGKITTIGLAAVVNGPIMNTTFSLVATWLGAKPVEDPKER